MKRGIAITLGIVSVVIIVLSSLILIKPKQTTSTTLSSEASKKKEQYVAPAQAPVPVLPTSFIQSFPSSIPKPHETYAPIDTAKMRKIKKQTTTAQLITGSKQNPNRFTVIQDPNQMNLMTPQNFDSVPQLQALASGMSPLAMINKYKKFSASNIDPAKNFL